MVTCLAFPHSRGLQTRNAAIDGLEPSGRWSSTTNAFGDDVPVPLSERRFSGTFNIRIGERVCTDRWRCTRMRRVILNHNVAQKLTAG